jgi:hypothetical protein
MVRLSTDANQTTMNTTKLAAIAALIAAQGITPTAEMVIGLAVRTLVESGQDPRTAFDAVMGDGSFQQLADDLWSEANA